MGRTPSFNAVPYCERGPRSRTAISGPRSRDRDQGTATNGPRSSVGHLIWKDCKYLRKGGCLAAYPDLQENFGTTNWNIIPGAIWSGVQGLSTPINCYRTQAILLVEVQDREMAQVVRRLATQVSHFFHKAIKADRGDSGRAPTKNTRSGEEHPPDRHQSLKRSSLASSQVHLDESSPPY
uniref:Uncharacterized protein n=1 Tax=Hyaloperonospora arabidopsidis (strain Emoy2) TaxID=559515 RepID=M4BGB9_HYAAE